MKNSLRAFHDKLQKNIKDKTAWWYFIFAAALLVLWMPYYLSFYPGIIRNDEIVCFKQIFGEYPYSNHHPVVFTMFLRLVYTVVNGFGGSMNAVVAAATFGQMLFFAAVLSGLFLFLWKRSNCIWLNYCAILFFMISPVIAKFAITLGKDTFFSGWFLLYILVLYCIHKENLLKKGWIFCICFVALSVMTAISRSNGLYIVILMCILLSVIWRSQGYRLWICNTSVLVLVLLIKGPVFDYFQVSEPSVAEAFTVPLQQIGYALSMDGDFRQEDKEYLNRILPIEDWKASYTPEISDSLKFHENFNGFYLNDTASEFLKVWARGLIPNFSYYVKAYLEQIRGYWDITQISDMGSWEVCENEYGIVQRDLWQEGLGFSIRRICILGVQAMRKLPVFNILTNEPCLILFWLGSFLYLVKKRQGGIAVTILAGLLLWGTLLLAAPASLQFRYLLSLHLLLPYVFFLLTMKNRARIKTETDS